ncbi:MAG: hypothetical protein ABEJ25_05930 [Candidatus Bipolaricaulia bacterium]
MYSNFVDIRRQQEEKRIEACSNNICRQNVRNENHIGDNQQNKERLICKIGLC